MPTTCGFPNCKFRSRYRGQEDNRHFYRIPKRPSQLRQRWLNAIGRTEETVVSQLRICSAHFPGGEKKDGDIPVPDPQFDPPLFITIPPRGENARFHIGRTAESKAKKSKTNHNRLFVKTNSNVDKNKDLYRHRHSNQLNIMHNLQDNSEIEQGDITDQIHLHLNQIASIKIPKMKDKLLRANEFTNESKLKLAKHLSLYKSHGTNHVNVSTTNVQTSFNSPGNVISSSTYSLIPSCAIAKKFNSHAASIFQHNAVNSEMTSTTTNTRPLVALLDGRDCSIEMPLLKDIATVAFCDAQSTAEIHEKVLNEAVGAFLYQSISLSREDLLKFKALKVVVRIGSSFHNIDVAAATDLGIAICNTPVECIEETADSTMLLILNMYRKTFWVSKAAQDKKQIGNVEHLRELITGSTRIRGSVLGLIGFGRIGIAVACRARSFGFKIIFYDPYVANGIERTLGVERCDTLNELLNRSDCVSLHCPLNAETQFMLNNETIRKMKFGVFLINTSAFELTMGSALLAALKTGHIKAAALDVHERDSINLISKTALDSFNLEVLSQMPNVICTPNCSWYSDESSRELRTSAAKEVRRALVGQFPEDLKNCVNRNSLLLRSKSIIDLENVTELTTLALKSQNSNIFTLSPKHPVYGNNVKVSPVNSLNALIAASASLPVNNILGGEMIDHFNNFATQLASGSFIPSDASMPNHFTTTISSSVATPMVFAQTVSNTYASPNVSLNDNAIATTSIIAVPKKAQDISLTTTSAVTSKDETKRSEQSHLSFGKINSSEQPYKMIQDQYSSFSEMFSGELKQQSSETTPKKDEYVTPQSPTISSPPSKISNFDAAASSSSGSSAGFHDVGYFNPSFFYKNNTTKTDTTLSSRSNLKELCTPTNILMNVNEKQIENSVTNDAIDCENSSKLKLLTSLNPIEIQKNGEENLSH